MMLSWVDNLKCFEMTILTVTGDLYETDDLTHPSKQLSNATKVEKPTNLC